MTLARRLTHQQPCLAGGRSGLPLPAIATVLATVLLGIGCRTTAPLRGSLEPVARFQLAGDGGTPIAVAWEPKGTALLVAGGIGPVQVWRSPVDGTSPPITFQTSERLIKAGFVDAKTVLIATEDGRMVLWDWTTGRTLWERKPRPGGHASFAAVSPDLKWGAFEGHAFDIRTGAEVGPAEKMTTERALEFSADGTRLLDAGFRSPHLALRELPSGAVRSWNARDHVTTAALSPDGRVVAAATRPGTVYLWRPPEEKAVHSWSVRGEPSFLRFSSDGQTVTVVSDEALSVYHLPTSRFLFQTPVRKPSRSWAAEGEFAASADVDGYVQLWNTARGIPIAEAKPFATGALGIAIKPDARLLAAADGEGAIVVMRWTDPPPAR